MEKLVFASLSVCASLSISAARNTGRTGDLRSDSELAETFIDIQLPGEPNLRRLGVGMRSTGCTCGDGNCGCCFNMKIPQIKVDREGCANLTYHPADFAIGVDVFWNGLPLYSNKLSAKNPPPLCVPIPIAILPTLDTCLHLSDLYTENRNLHACLDVQVRMQRSPLLELHFNCMSIGDGNFQFMKPGAPISAGNPLFPLDRPSTSSETPQLGVDIYDPVTETKKGVDHATV